MTCHSEVIALGEQIARGSTTTSSSIIKMEAPPEPDGAPVTDDPVEARLLTRPPSEF